MLAMGSMNTSKMTGITSFVPFLLNWLMSWFDGLVLLVVLAGCACLLAARFGLFFLAVFLVVGFLAGIVFYYLPFYYRWVKYIGGPTNWEVPKPAKRSHTLYARDAV